MLKFCFFLIQKEETEKKKTEKKRTLVQAQPMKLTERVFVIYKYVLLLSFTYKLSPPQHMNANYLCLCHRHNCKNITGKHGQPIPPCQ